MKKKYVCLPPLKVMAVDELCCSYEAYIALLCEIPYGMVTTDSMLYECIEKVYGYKNLRINYSPLVGNDMNQRLYPFWRLVSTRGHLLNWKEKDLQREMLESEGHIIDQPKPNEDGLVVRDYKEKIFSFDCLHITVRQDVGDLYRAFLKSKKETE